MEKPILDKLTSRLKSVLASASRVSEELQHRHVGTEHLVYGMLQESGSLAYSILKKFGLTPEFVRNELDLMEKGNGWKEELSAHTRAAFEKGARTAFQYHHRYIGTEHILYGILTLKDSRGYKILEKSPVDVKSLLQQVQIVLKSTSHFPDLSNLLGSNPPSKQAGSAKMGSKSDLPIILPAEAGIPSSMHGGSKKQKTPAFDFFTQDLTELASRNKFDPVIGRSKEVDRVMSILNRKNKNNPILIGEPGVGKTAIVTGLAQRIASGQVPSKLQGKKILSLDMTGILAGTTFRGEFEERIKELMRELEENRDTILFIDEIHTIVGAGSSGGSMDAANMLKPMLARGEVSIIGATTIDEFRKHIEKDAALERRFQPVQVKEPSPEETITILEGAREAYEAHHGLTVTDEAIQAAVEMSIRYIPDRFLPDKALDLLDEAAATLQLKIAGTEEAQKANTLKNELAKIRKEKETAIESEHYEEALLAKRKEDTLSEELARTARTLSAQNEAKRISITAEHIAQVVADSTGIPAGRLLKEESKKLANLEDIMRKHIVGQEQAIHAVSRYVRRSRAGIANPNRPLGSFIFLGPTGVGKTETAKVLAKEVFENADALIRVDMSEFMESHSVSRLIGAPAGYVGYEEGGKLTESVRRQPYAVILFDEIEKAHRDVWNILLQILDEGELTDSHGRKVNFRNTIIIMTSNIGSHELSQQARMGFAMPEESSERDTAQEKYEQLKASVLKELQDRMAPELLSRIDQIIVYAPLSMKDMEAIAKHAIQNLQTLLSGKAITLEVTKGVSHDIAERAFKEGKGARPIRRIVQELLEDPIAHSIINKEITEGQTVTARKAANGIVVEAMQTVAR
ncbi:MAG TPA: ATP-dependent Clp protease ATP-binding subunit [Candidatus Andersenbacteria bacterium]|nr:ATP-dependent Clp protease ATP-binding subunit [Candidatus Andersenbacteria bacterium]